MIDKFNWHPYASTRTHLTTHKHMHERTLTLEYIWKGRPHLQLTQSIVVCVLIWHIRLEL